MPVLRIDNFAGMAPIFDPRKLPAGNSTNAQGTRFDGSGVGPFYSSQATNIDSSGLTVFQSGGYNIGRLFRFVVTGQQNLTLRWLAWPSNSAGGQHWIVIDPAPSPIPNDQYNRLYWTSANDKMYAASGPVVTDTLAQTATSNNSVNVRALGIPAPLVAPALTASSATGSTAPITAITNASPAVVTVSGTNPFKNGQLVQAVLANAPTGTPSNMSELSGKQFLVGNVTGNTLELVGSDSTNYSKFTSAGGWTLERVFLDSDYEDRAYVFTLVSDWGEEGPPSPPSAVKQILLDGSAAVVLTWVVGTYTHVNRMRLYRTVSGQSGTNFFFVGEIPFTGTITPSTLTGAVSGFSTITASLVDAVPPVSIGELLPSTDWTAPVAGMFGLISMPNGFMLAFKDNTVYACEAYEPHAWPDKYRKTVDYPIVGAAVMGQSAVIATKGRPYVATGSDPYSLTLSKLDIDAPCIAKEGIVSIGDGVVYPTFEGLVLIKPYALPQIITQQIMTKAQWLSYWQTGTGGQTSPPTMYGAFYNDHYLAISNNSLYPSLAFRVSAATGESMFAVAPPEQHQFFLMPNLIGMAPANDLMDDTLHFCKQIGGAFNQLVQFDAQSSGQFDSFSWSSKFHQLLVPMNFSVAQVFASSYPVTVTINATSLADAGGVHGELGQMTRVFGPTAIQNSLPFRLPAGFMALEWQVTLAAGQSASKTAISSFVMATSMGELKGGQ